MGNNKSSKELTGLSEEEIEDMFFDWMKSLSERMRKKGFSSKKRKKVYEFLFIYFKLNIYGGE